MIASHMTREPEFDTEQVDLLLASEAFEKNIGSHGQLLSEATAEAADPNNYEGGYRYVGKGPFTDWAKKAELDAIDAYRTAAGEKANLNGMYWRVEKMTYDSPGGVDGST